MSLKYKAVGWNRQKKIYDTVLLAGVAIYLTLFVTLNLIFHPEITAETLLIRAFGTASIILLHIVLSIGPLCRLDSRFLPLLYNRRHMGVTMFLLGAVHGVFALIQFHALGNVNPLESLFFSNTHYDSLANFPFQPLGFIALVILFLMAATSHDFWLSNLTAPIWKSLHMLVYIAYGLLVMHVSLGILQTETSPILSIALGAGVIWITGIHLIATLKGRALDAALKADRAFVEVCRVDEIPENRGRIFCLSGERIAVFKYDGKLSAISNVCQHQNGPLGEGCVIDGLVTCPWHGFQYNPADGTSPPPFTEKVPTFNILLKQSRVLIDPVPNPPGTHVEPIDLKKKGEAHA